MEQADLNERLSRISTRWQTLFQAHGGPAAGAADAQRRLLGQYHGAVYRYLLGAVRDPDAAEELCQEFALRFLRGDFRRADPERGRFRDYLKTALINLVNDHFHAEKARPRLLSPDGPEPAAPMPESLESDRGFLSSWREELLNRTWQALAQAQPTYRAVLLLRIENPDMPSAEMATELTSRFDKPFTADGVRKALQRAHAKFAELLIDETAASLEGLDLDKVEEELKALDLLKYCRSALERRKRT